MARVIQGSANLSVDCRDVPVPTFGLRTDVQVTYCVYSTWFSRSFKGYVEALNFVEHLKGKYKRISYISLDVSTVLVENFK